MVHERILVVEDEADIRDLLVYNLERHGYVVQAVGGGRDALDRMRTNTFHLVLLDLMLPDMDGLDVCRNIKNDAATRSTSIVMLTARGGDVDIIAGLELGADDYIVKPFTFPVLCARLSSVLRRRVGGSNDGSVIHYHELMMDIARHCVKCGGDEIELTASEFSVLAYLAMHPGYVFTRRQIIRGIRGGNYAVTERSIDVLIVGLRKKLGAAGDYIETIRGVGYRFAED